jgi:hypothetical protein
VRRVARILLNAATAVSLVLFVLTIVLWVRSYRPVASERELDSLYVSRGRPAVWLVSADGRLAVAYQRGDHFTAPLRPFNVLGVQLGGYAGPAALRWNLYLPYWALVTLSLAVPLCRHLARRHARRRQSAGLCPLCGYDLRATPERCPECGTMSAR